MAKSIVEVYACDRCGKEPAYSWTITGPGGWPRQIDLCEHHGAPIGNAYALGRPVVQQLRSTPSRARRHPVPPPPPAKLPVPPPEPEPVWR